LNQRTKGTSLYLGFCHVSTHCSGRRRYQHRRGLRVSTSVTGSAVQVRASMRTFVHDTWTENRIWSVVAVTDNDRDENSHDMCRSIKPYAILYLSRERERERERRQPRLACPTFPPFSLCFIATCSKGVGTRFDLQSYECLSHLLNLHTNMARDIRYVMCVVYPSFFTTRGSSLKGRESCR